MQATKSGRTRERQAKEFQDFCERAVCVSELENCQCEVSELQMSIRLSRGFLRLTEASCQLVNLRFLAYGSSEKDDSCNKPSL